MSDEVEELSTISCALDTDEEKIYLTTDEVGFLELDRSDLKGFITFLQGQLEELERSHRRNQYQRRKAVKAAMKILEEECHH